MTDSIDIGGVLAGRGLLTAAQEAGWRPHKRHGVEGWAYPVYNAQGVRYAVENNGLTRWKAADGSVPKYLWLHGKPDGVRYYLHPDTPQAIKDSGGILYLASGEPDVLAFRAAGLKNTTCWFDGETSVPATLADDLKRLGVVIVWYYPDRDRTGLQAASKIAEALKDSGIELGVQELPGEVGSKFDVNHLWQACEYQPQRFRERLSLLDPVADTDLYLYGDALDDAPLDTGKAVDFDANGLYREWMAQIVDALGQPAKRSGKVQYWRCPLPGHEDKHPSFRVTTHQNPDFPWPVCTCGIQHNRDAWDTVADALGVDSWDEFKARKRAEGRDIPDDVPPPRLARDYADTGPDNTLLFVDSTEATQRLLQQLRGERVPDIEPAIFPFNRLHQFTGFAHVLMPKKLIYILGVSGGGKTFFAEQTATVWEMLGEDAIWWGPEWTPEEMRARALQRAGGLDMTRLNLHNLWLIDEARGVPKHQNRGTPVGQAALDRSIKILERLTQYPGRTHYITENDLPPAALMKRIQDKTIELRANGRRCRHLYIDYFQLWNNSGGKDDWSGPEQAMNQLKMLVANLNMFGWIVLQPRKGDSEETREGEILHHASAQGISDQKCQLMITLTPVFDDSGKKQEEARITVVKNSTGTTGTLHCPVNWPRLMWIDEKESTAPKPRD